MGPRGDGNQLIGARCTVPLHLTVSTQSIETSFHFTHHYLKATGR